METAQRKRKPVKEGEIMLQVRLPIAIREKLFELAKLDQRKGANLARKIIIEYIAEHSEGIDLKEISLD